jgi:GT2 family glycosyltransferase
MSSAIADLVVAIVNHSNRDDTLACLESLEADRERGLSVRVVVLDNASDDGSVDAIRAAHPHVEVIAQEVRRGFGANQNAIIQATSSRYVLALNNDTLVERGALDTLVRYLDEHPGVGAAGPRVVGRDGEPQLSAWTFPTVWNAAVHVVAGSRPAGPAPAEVGYVSGCALMLRRSVLTEIGGFDEDYFMYAEEKDLCRRIHDAGSKVELVPSATVVHLEARSSAGASARRETEFWRSQRLYLRKHHSTAGALAIEAQTALQRLALAAVVGVAGALPARLRPRQAQPGLARQLAHQARSSLRPPHGPGLRELADEQNARQRRAAA